MTTFHPFVLDRMPEGLRRERRSVRDEDRTIGIQTDSPAEAIVELIKWIEKDQLRLMDIHMKRPTLEDVFIELTGKKLRE